MSLSPFALVPLCLAHGGTPSPSSTTLADRQAPASVVGAVAEAGGKAAPSVEVPAAAIQACPAAPVQAIGYSGAGGPAWGMACAVAARSRPMAIQRPMSS